MNKKEVERPLFLLFVDHCEEGVFVDDRDAELLSFFEFGRAHVFAGENIVCLFGYRTYVLASVRDRKSVV